LRGADAVEPLGEAAFSAELAGQRRDLAVEQNRGYGDQASAPLAAISG
jgi:hypothetical protein